MYIKYQPFATKLSDLSGRHCKDDANMDQVREEARDRVEMLTSKQLKANAGKSKFVIFGTLKLRTEIRTSL